MTPHTNSRIAKQVFCFPCEPKSSASRPKRNNPEVRWITGQRVLIAVLVLIAIAVAVFTILALQGTVDFLENYDS